MPLPSLPFALQERLPPQCAVKTSELCSNYFHRTMSQHQHAACLATSPYTLKLRPEADCPGSSAAVGSFHQWNVAAAAPHRALQEQRSDLTASNSPNPTLVLEFCHVFCVANSPLMSHWCFYLFLVSLKTCTDSCGTLYDRVSVFNGQSVQSAFRPSSLSAGGGILNHGSTSGLTCSCLSLNDCS